MAENLYRELIGFATTSTPEIPVLVKSTMKRPQIQNKEVLNHYKCIGVGEVYVAN